MLDLIVSDGQAGSDQAGLRAVRGCGIPTGGWAPLGWETEDGPAPGLADFGLVECLEPGYPAWTRANVQDSSGTIWFGNPDSPGGRTTLRACHDLGMPVLEVLDGFTRPSDVAAWIEGERVRVLNVAGSRESRAPGIGGRVEAFMLAVLRRLASV